MADRIASPPLRDRLWEEDPGTIPVLSDIWRRWMNALWDAVNLIGRQLDGLLVTPPLHAPTHNTGGTDPITALAGEVITTGEIADARLSDNVALEDVVNIFTRDQRFHKTGPMLWLQDTSQPADQKMFRICNVSQLFYIQALNDAVTLSPGYLRIDRLGNVVVTGTIQGASLVNTPLGAGSTVPDANLSANVALKNINNNFVAQTLADGTMINGNNGLFVLYSAGSAADIRLWRFLNYGAGNLTIEAMNDAQTVVQVGYTFSRAGQFNAVGNIVSNSGYLYAAGAHVAAATGVYAGTDFYEKGRSTPQGHWIAVPYAAGNFYGLAPMTLSMAGATVLTDSYTLVGQTMYWTCYVINATLGGAVSTAVYVNIPLGYAGANYDIGQCSLAIPGEGWVPGTVEVEPGNARVVLMKFNKAAFTAVGNAHFRFSIAIRLA